MNIKENNKLVADFMGMKLKKGNFWSKILGYADEFIIINGKPKWSLSDIPYHKSWKWLMTVVEKIESIKDDYHGYFGVHINSNNCTIQGTNFRSVKIDWNNPVLFMDFYGVTKIDATYKAVVGFIKWYNKNKV